MSNRIELADLVISSLGSLPHLRRKLIKILSLIEPDPTLTSPLIARLLDAVRGYLTAVSDLRIKLVLFPGEHGRLGRAALEFHLKSAADESGSTCQGQLIAITERPDDNPARTFVLPLRVIPAEAMLKRCAEIFVEPSREQLFDDVQRERAKSEELIRNILPDEIATALKNSKDVHQLVYDYHPSVSILFSDEIGFTRLTRELDAEKLVDLIDRLFCAFDDISDRHGLEKIKTIGDSYLAVCGIPAAVPDHADRACRMGLEMLETHQAFMSRECLDLGIRIGIHSGPAVAGVIGRRKYAYDLWGDTVNLASRMESTCPSNSIQISLATKELLVHDIFALQSRGSIEVKGGGMMSTFLLRSANRSSIREQCSRLVLRLPGPKPSGLSCNGGRQSRRRIRLSPASRAGFPGFVLMLDGRLMRSQRSCLISAKSPRADKF